MGSTVAIGAGASRPVIRVSPASLCRNSLSGGKLLVQLRLKRRSGGGMTWRSFVAMGDSFSEGLDAPYPDGTYRGWADLEAARLADASGPDFRYANLAIRGKFLDQVVGEQLEPTVAMHPDLVCFAAGGND